MAWKQANIQTHRIAVRAKQSAAGRRCPACRRGAALTRHDSPEDYAVWGESWYECRWRDCLWQGSGDELRAAREASRRTE